MMEQDPTDPTGITCDGNSRAAAKRARERKANAAVNLKLSGATWEQIAITLGYPNARTAQVAVELALEKQLHTDDKNKMRKVAGMRLERLLLGVWQKAIDPESPEQMTAQTRAREAINDYVKLYGLQAPTEITVHNPTQNEIMEWVAQITQQAAPKVIEYDILELEPTEVEDAEAI